MIRSFRSHIERAIWQGEAVKSLPVHLQQQARRKLRMLNSAETLVDLAAPPGNRLERLRGGRAGQFSIRINDQWRICFRWSGRDSYDVEIVDYH